MRIADVLWVLALVHIIEKLMTKGIDKEQDTGEQGISTCGTGIVVGVDSLADTGIEMPAVVGVDGIGETTISTGITIEIVEHSEGGG